MLTYHRLTGPQYKPKEKPSIKPMAEGFKVSNCIPLNLLVKGPLQPHCQIRILIWTHNKVVKCCNGPRKEWNNRCRLEMQKWQLLVCMRRNWKNEYLPTTSGKSSFKRCIQYLEKNIGRKPLQRVNWKERPEMWFIFQQREWKPLIRSQERILKPKSKPQWLIIW